MRVIGGRGVLATAALLIATPLPCANARDVIRISGPVYACTDFQAARSLAAQTASGRPETDGRRPLLRTRRCTIIYPGIHLGGEWERLGTKDGIFLMRRLPPKPGEGPLLFPPSPSLRPVSPLWPTIRQSLQHVFHPASYRGAASAASAGTSRQEPGHNVSADAPAGRFVAFAAARQSSATTPPRHPRSSPLTTPVTTLSVILAGLIFFVFALVAGRRHRLRKRQRRAWRIVENEIEAKAAALQIRRLQLVTTDHYGTVHQEKWRKERAYFCRTRLLPRLKAEGLEEFWPAMNRRVHQRIEKTARASHAGKGPARLSSGDSTLFHPRMTPIAYEHHCALLLKRAGWNARVTPASGDQGADVIATRNGRKIVVQCKLYSRPVGNKAVQEAFTAMQHQRAHAALVVSNTDYTPQARQLASTTGVYLLHHQELTRFEERMRA